MNKYIYIYINKLIENIISGVIHLAKHILINKNEVEEGEEE